MVIYMSALQHQRGKIWISHGDFMTYHLHGRYWLALWYGISFTAGMFQVSRLVEAMAEEVWALKPATAGQVGATAVQMQPTTCHISHTMVPMHLDMLEAMGDTLEVMGVGALVLVDSRLSALHAGR